MKKVGLVLMGLLLMASSAPAQKGDRDFMRKVRLRTPFCGASCWIQARAVIGRRSGVEFFAAQALSNFPDGTQLTVFVNTVNDPTFVELGRIELLNGAGELRLSQTLFRGEPGRIGFPADASVTSFKEVRLQEGDMTWAWGSF